MGVIALISVVLYTTPLVVLFFGVLIAARRGYPIVSGRQKYAMAALLTGMMALACFILLHTRPAGIVLVINFGAMVVMATAAMACLLGILVYRGKN